jgi:tetratricopeptide (TPR) repeat protein
VYFAVTVDDMMDLDKYLSLEGLVFRFDPELPQKNAVARGAAGEAPIGPGEIEDNVDLVKTRRNLEELYKYRGLLRADGTLDPEVYRDDNDEKLCTNYAAAWARMAIAYRGRDDIQQAVDCMQRAVNIAPHYDPISGGLGGLLLEAERYATADSFYRARLEQRPEDVRVYLGLGYLAQHDGRWEEALDWYLQGLRIDPHSSDLLASLFQTYYQLGRLDEAENVLMRWVERNPNDQSARQRLLELRSEIAVRGGADTSIG